MIPLNVFPDTAQINQQGQLTLGGCNTLDLAQEYGTPVYVFDEDTLRSRCRSFVGEFDQRENYRQFSREIARIRGEQENLGRQTRGMDTYGKTPGDLSPEQMATLRRLALRQRELSREFDRLQATMERVAESLADTDLAISATLDRALQTARSAAVSGLMQEAAEGVENNQLGRVGDLQQRV